MNPFWSATFSTLKRLMNALGSGNRSKHYAGSFRLPDVVKTEYESFDEEEWLVIVDHLRKAIAEIDEFRIRKVKPWKPTLWPILNHFGPSGTNSSYEAQRWNN
jgi:hypothetical protein